MSAKEDKQPNEDLKERVNSMQDNILISALLLMIFSLVIIGLLLSIDSKISSPSIQEPPLREIGIVEEIGYDSVKIDGILYQDICNNRNKDYIVGDTVLIESAPNGYINCDKIVILQKRGD
jgi:hypothetical protein